MGCSIMSAPPRDAAGRVQPHDHDQIHAEDIMLRGISSYWIKPTESGGHRISSGAFQASSKALGGGLSLGAKKVLDCNGKSVDEWGSGRFDAVVCLEAGELRAANLKVGWDPTEDDNSHCNAWGKLTRRLKRSLAREAKWRYLDS